MEKEYSMWPGLHPKAVGVTQFYGNEYPLANDKGNLQKNLNLKLKNQEAIFYG